jgi:predicted DNA-binding protein
MNIQYVRLDDQVCELLNRMAQQQRRTVSDVVNEILRERLEQMPGARPADSKGSE